MRKIIIIILLGVLLIGLVITGFLKTTKNTDKQKPVRLAYQNRIGSGACIIAANKNLFRQEGVRVESFRFNSGPACAEALYSDSVDIATMGDATAIIAVSKNPRLTIIGSHGQGEHRHRMMVKNQSSIRELTHIKGKRLAVKKGTSTHGGLLFLLSSRDIDPSELKIIDLVPSLMLEALISGSIDAFVASEPTPSLAESMGARELITLGNLGNQYPILMVAKKSFLQNRAHDVQMFLKAIDQAAHFINNNPKKAVNIIAAITGLDKTSTYNAMKQHSFELNLDTKIIDSLQKTALFLKDQGIIEKIPNFEKSSF